KNPFKGHSARERLTPSPVFTGAAPRGQTQVMATSGLFQQAPNTDILCSNLEGTKFVHIQVKTFVPGIRACSVGRKAEKSYGDNFFWVLGGIPTPNTIAPFQYFIIPSAVVAKNVAEAHKQWLETLGKGGRQHEDNSVRTIALPPYKGFNGWEIAEYEERWDLIEDRLAD
ncbi:hypothetical protein, partial [Synechococcus sp. CCY9202]|uniref:hypothetical protein n=1 Tax=Synechococcus sp. CCY9202 TaxID=174698 RepID=UPI002B1ED227